MVSLFVKTWRVTWMALSSIATIAVVVSLLWPPPARQASAKPAAATVSTAFHLSPEGDIIIPADSSLREKVEIVQVEPEEVSFPLLRVTGSIVARLIDTAKVPQERLKAAEDRWQFSSEDLASTYAEWLKTQTEIDTAKKQLAKVQQLTDTTVNHLTAVVERTKKLYESGTEAGKELQKAKVDLEQAKLQGQKDLYAAQSNLRLAEKNLDSLERRFQQAGIDPAIFETNEEDTTLIVANVPEQKMALVHEGQSCAAQLYGYPGRQFTGHVERIGETVSQDRRTMRVLFHITDSEDLLKPGMFAEVGLGTDKRPALLVPAEAMLHVANTDYLLVAEGDGHWRITACEIGESHGTKVEVTSGIAAGDRIIGRGAILLKPLVVQAKIK
jgi:cobalt-zinc-cadmium efflux system membrane fusion protein